MTYRINDTADYHKQELATLGWEWTVCNMLENRESPCRRILKIDQSYGLHLFDFLEEKTGFGDVHRLIEVGGGYGFLMRDFLSRKGDLAPVMVDISPVLLGEQKKCLKGHKVEFIQDDFFNLEKSFLQSFSMAVFNENLGDFPTVCDLKPEILSAASGSDPLLIEIRKFHDKYQLPLPVQTGYTVNLGALRVLESLCEAGIPRIFLSEHSCESRVPLKWADLIEIESTGHPERIKLKGHDEFTIQFSHLEKIANYYDYKCLRGPFADYLEPEMSDEIYFIMKSRSCHKEEHEVIRHFLEDLFKYEYLLLCKS